MRYNKDRKIDENNFIEVCIQSITMAKAAKKLDLPFMTFKRIAIKLNCYKTNASGKGLQKIKVKLDDIITNKVKFSRCQLKKRLLANNLFDYKCAIKECSNVGQWLGKKLSLELDHINGISDDNRLENLRFLCPNCHSQTITFRKKKSK